MMNEENRNNYNGPVPPIPKFEASHVPVRRPKELWKLGGLLVLAGLILFAAGWLNGAPGGSMYLDSSGFHLSTPESGGINKVVVNQELDRFDSVEVEAGFDEIVFIESDHYGLEISLPEGYEPEWELDNGKLYVKTDDFDISNVRIQFFSMDFSASFVKIYYPEGEEFDSIELESGSGEIEGEFPHAETITLTTGSGDIDAGFNGPAEVYAKAGSGSVKLNNDLNEAEVRTKIEIGSGSIEIDNGSWVNLQVEAGSGSVEIDAELSGETKIKTGSGSVYVNTENSQGYDISTGSGSVRVNGERIRGGDINYSSSSDNFMEVNTGSGRIELKIGE